MNNDDCTKTNESSNDVSFVIESGYTRRYHRCFKVNLCLNISMLVAFVCLIVFGPWYTMHYQNNQGQLDAEFSLILLYTTVEDAATNQQTYNEYWAPKFAKLCHKCIDGSSDPTSSQC